MGKKVILKNGIKIIESEEFKDNLDIEEIVIPDSVEQIGEGAFEGCTNLKKITLSKNLKLIGANTFKNCTSLEEITIPESLHYYSYGLFQGCTNLKKINNPKALNYIDDLALSGCSSLEEFTIQESTTSIGYKAFYGCKKIKEIHIPKNVSAIDIGAFSNMESLEKITVDKDNEKYLSDEDVALLDKDGLLLQYAIGSPAEKYIVGYYQTIIDNSIGEPLVTNALIYNIADHAFENAKNLKRIEINSELESIGKSTFAGCDNLHDLEIFFSSYGTSLLIHTHKLPDENAEIPFRKITIEDGVTTICANIEDLFKEAEEVILPNTLVNINSKVFTKSNKLKRIVIPPTIKSIAPDTFNDNTILVFLSDKEIPARNFNTLQTKTDLDYYLRKNDRGNIRIFSLKDGTYYIQIDDYDIVKINKKDIDNMSSSSKELSDEPEKFIDFIIGLLQLNCEIDNILTGLWLDPKLEELFKKFANDFYYAEEITNKKVAKSIREIIESSGIKDEFLFSALLIKKVNKDDLLKIIANYTPSLSRFFRMAKYSDDKDDLEIDKLIEYCNLLEKYQRYDRIFYNPAFFKRVSKENQELIIKHYNKNLKRLLISSKTLDDTYGVNLNDLINLCNALGIFCEDKQLSQKLTTFVTEKIVSDTAETPIQGNDIHTIFGDLKPREEIDYEFISFFLENYKNLLKEEKQTSGIISRIYNLFRQISGTSTSHRGEQRHLKVTLNKCLDYFLLSKFDGVTEENKELASFLQKYYSEKGVLKAAEGIIKEASEIPSNIFEGENLKEESENDFTYEWLPKQEYDNLILGKYCNCCAHILGAGAGIMRASMVDENIQNLVIRNQEGIIIAKMTLYVNKANGYGVYNTAEVNINYRSYSNLKKIYNTFMRGTRAFIERYNKTASMPIKQITIGAYRNAFEDIQSTTSTLLDTPNYSEYGYYVDNKFVGKYDGDSKKEQLLVYKKEI